MAGKYDPLRLFLNGRTDSRVEMTFDDIANLVGGLPISAFKHKPWWANDVSHVQASAWMHSGYVASLNLERRRIVFHKSAR